MVQDVFEIHANGCGIFRWKEKCVWLYLACDRKTRLRVLNGRFYYVGYQSLVKGKTTHYKKFRILFVFVKGRGEGWRSRCKMQISPSPGKTYNPHIHEIARSDRIGFTTKISSMWGIKAYDAPTLDHDNTVGPTTRCWLHFVCQIVMEFVGY